nr:YadA family autotransporter adhesin [Rahnella bruchi]
MASATASGATAIGRDTSAAATNALALGNGASSTLANSVALGSNSTASAVSATTANTVANSFISGKTLSVIQAPTNGVVAIGNRQIQGVADGQLSSTSTDAVNGSQLYQVTTGLNSNTNALGSSTASALGGGAAYNSTTGAWTAPSYSIQGTTFSDVGSALTKVDSGLTALNGGNTGLVQRTATSNVATMTATGGSATTPGTAQKLTNLAAGNLAADSTDAVNGSQLFTTNTKVGTNATNLANLGTSTANALGGGAAYNSTTGSWTAPSYTVQGSNYSNIGDAFGGVDGSLTALTSSISEGTTGVVQRTDTANKTVLTAANGTAAAPGETQTLSNLTAGNLAADSTDAVNGSQLFATNTNVGTNTTNLANLGTSTASALGGGAAYNSTTGAWTAPSYTVQGSNYSNIGDAFGGVDGSLTALTGSISEGTTGVVQRTDTANKTVLTAANGTAVAPGETQTLSNLAAGNLAAGSTDAVNGSQLFATNANVATSATNLANLGTSTASSLGGGAAYNSSTGAWTAPSYTVQGSNYSNIGDAFGGVDGSLTALTGSISEGTTGVVQRTDTANKAVLTAANGTAVAPGEAQTLSNLAAGNLAADSTDAVNGSQLFATNTNVGTNTTNLANLGTSTAGALGGGAAYNSSTGAWTAPSYSIQGSSYGNIGDAFGGVDRSLTSLSNSVASGTNGVVQRTGTTNVATLTAADGTASAPGAAQTLTNLAQGQLTADSTDAVNGSQLYAVADQVSKNTTDISGLTTIVNNATESNLVKQNSEDNSITIGASKAGATVSIAGTQGNRTLGGVADGIAANDAATVGQLQGVAGNISSRDDTGLGVAKATGKNGLAVGAGAVASGDFSTANGAGAQAIGTNSSASGSEAKATAANATAVGQGATASGASTLAAGQGSSATGSQAVALGVGSVASGSHSVALGYGSVAERDNSVSVGSAGHERQIANVAAGTSRTDAANVGQVNDAFQSLDKSVNNKINDLDDKLTGGIASAMAMSGIPQAYLPDSSLIGASASTYNGQSAISVGVSKTSESGKWIMKISGSGNTQSDFGASVGVGYQW